MTSDNGFDSTKITENTLSGPANDQKSGNVGLVSATDQESGITAFGLSPEQESGNAGLGPTSEQESEILEPGPTSEQESEILELGLTSEQESEIFDTESIFEHIRQMFMTNKLAAAGAIVILIFIVIAVFAHVFAPFDPYYINLDNRLAGPGGGHLLGTDAFGRDVLSRIFYGSRISLVIGLTPSAIAIVIGTVLGLIAGFMGKTADFIIMRLADIVLSFPSLLLAMVIMYTLGASLLNLFIALSIIDWGVTARTVRAQTLSLREKDFVEAARALGVKKRSIMFRHILPNCIPSLMVILTLDIPTAVLAEAGLSFLGVGAQPPQASWGLMVSENKSYLFTAPWVALAPGLAIVLLVLAFNFVGDGLRDALDPYMQE